MIKEYFLKKLKRKITRDLQFQADYFKGINYKDGDEIKVIEVKYYKLEDGSAIMIVLVEQEKKKLFEEGELRKIMDEAWEKVEKNIDIKNI